MQNCVVCCGVITHPLCEECLALEFRAWLADIDASLEELFSQEHLFRNDGEGCACIRCGASLTVCRSCALTQFIHWLSGVGVAPELVARAVEVFLPLPPEQGELPAPPPLPWV